MPLEARASPRNYFTGLRRLFFFAAEDRLMSAPFPLEGSYTELCAIAAATNAFTSG